ncbi:MAG: Hsp20/alpha crystallin family protein [candidate division NC10 bacterium]|nr:Hsp20/alpha crystallin family protein [candidate division NC10 bacterium]
MRALQPWTGLTSLRKEMERLFDRFWESDLPELAPVGEWTPRLDLSETKETLVVRAEIPGLEAKDVQISLQDQVLTIKGEKKQEKEEKDEHHYRMERSYGVFARSLRLPVAVDREKVTAKFKNGVLTIALPKAPSAKGTTIQVKGE